MEGDAFSRGMEKQMEEGKLLKRTFDKSLFEAQNGMFINESFVQAQNILDQNRLLINEINQNHESKIPDNLNRNVGLIRELNNNIRKVVDLYAHVSTSFCNSKSIEEDASSERYGKASSNRPPL